MNLPEKVIRIKGYVADNSVNHCRSGCLNFSPHFHTQTPLEMEKKNTSKGIMRPKCVVVQLLVSAFIH